MKKILIRLALLVSSLFIFLFVGKPTVSAENELNNIYIEVELQENGTGVVTEHRQMNMDEGTELYITLDNLQDSELLDFTVRNYTEVEDWDSDGSMEEKAGQYGVIDDGDELELVWGIGEYGENTYELTYTLSNLVCSLEDGQGLLWNFDTFSDIPAENLTVNIRSFEPFTQEDVQFWGFGFEGNMQLINGDIVWEAYEEVGDDNNVTPLLQFPQDYYNTQATVDMTLEEQYEMAADGSSAYNNDGSLGIVGMLVIFGIILLVIVVIIIAIIYSLVVSKTKKEAGDLVTAGKRLKMNENLHYKYIPYNGESLADIAFLLKGIYTGYFEDYFAAYLLKWVRDGKINIETQEKDAFFGTKYKTQVTIFDYQDAIDEFSINFDDFIENIEENLADYPYEFGLWLMLLDASDSAGVISDDRIKNWADDHAKELEEYADYLYEYSKKELEKQALVYNEEANVWGTTLELNISTYEVDKLYNQIVQFKNYLNDTELEAFVNYNQEISFEEALIWSVLFGKSDQVTEKIDSLIPNETLDGSYYYPYWYSIHGATSFRNEWSSGLSRGGFNSQASGGSGGATSAGGGAGAGGGGGGGAR